MRLCLSEKDGQQGQHRTTADWMSYIQDSESEDGVSIASKSACISV